MKKREAILIVIAVIVTALAYFSSKQTEKRVQQFIEQKESKEAIVEKTTNFWIYDLKMNV